MACNRIVGIGSPHGDDSIGWLLIERLRSRADINAELLTGTPDRLVDLAQDCDRLIVADAARTESPAGSVLRLVWPDPRIFTDILSSTHAFGVAESLRLAEALGRLPPGVVVLAMSTANTNTLARPGNAVLLGLDALERAALTELDRPF